MKLGDLSKKHLRKTLEPSQTSESPDYKKMFRDARRTFDEKESRGHRGPLKPWDESWNEYVKRTTREEREALLDEQVPERVCGRCGELRLRSRQWVILRGTGLKTFEPLACVCRGCYRKYHVNLSEDVGGRPRKR